MTTHDRGLHGAEDPGADDPPSGDASGLPSWQQVAAALRAGKCPKDLAFDQFLPRRLRVVSAQYWTPLIVALRVAGWLERLGVTTVVDIGSGAGKFCVATALACRSTFIGIEQRGRLVAASRLLATRFEVDDRVQFIEATLCRDGLPEAEAYYLYNSFGENLFSQRYHLDEDVELSREVYERDVRYVEDFLARAPIGTHIIKYNGFGGRMPPTYDALFVDREMPDVLRVWRKNRTA